MAIFQPGVSAFPAGYKPLLDLYETQDAIGRLKRIFAEELSDRLNLKRVSAPLFVDPQSGLNDDLSGVERAVSFDIPSAACRGEVVHSLAKWKRLALQRYDFFPNKGLYTDMNAIRREEELDNYHSIYVDQWDWELVVQATQRNFQTVQIVVEQIHTAIRHTSERLRYKYPQLPKIGDGEIFFVSAAELESLKPDMSPDEREDWIARDKGAVFIHGIGYPLESGAPHSRRAPDYDDWNLNGDIVFYDDVCCKAMELSSMGMRVDPEQMDKQLSFANCDHRRELSFHRMLLAGELPQTIGGGIGQSRLSMLLLGKAHIGEVQSSIWDKQTEEAAKLAGVTLL